MHGVVRKAHVFFQKNKTEFIVTLRGYQTLAQRQKLLKALLIEDWIEVARDNEAYALPSDFFILRNTALSGSGLKPFLKLLRANPLVKSITPHQTIEAGLLGVQSTSDYNPEPGEPVPLKLGAAAAWAEGYTGSNVKVAIFDTGLSRSAKHLNFVAERKDWTSEKTVDDVVGHGTFVAGMVAGINPQCMGMAPDSILHLFRVFTTRRVSFTAWFLDAFNYAIHSKVNVLNLSIGGPDFMDQPFTDKVAEVVSSGIIMVSAIGNDGPLWGTLNNPADMSPVVGVGGLGRSSNHVALYSSRGMTTWELPRGAGRVKPDLVTYSAQLWGPDRNGGCMVQSGTSMASPVIAGAIAVLISSVGDENRHLVNPGSIKQVLTESAVRLSKASVFEQGGGRLNLDGAIRLLKAYTPRISFYPSYYDLTECPYFSPYCEQPLYYSSMPLLLNATIINGVSVTGKIVAEPTLVALNEGGRHIRVSFDYPSFVWPWSGYLGIRILVSDSGRDFVGVAEVLVSLRIMTPQRRIDTVELPIRIRIISTPPRRRRLLWDQYHNARYPPGYFPRDDLAFVTSPFDWNGDHIYSNFLGFFRYARKLGFFVEVLGEPWTCFDAQNYGALLLVDPEEEYWEEEQKKLENDLRNKGLSLLVLADWYNVDVMKSLRFDDQNTQKEWTPVTGGAHLPALNDFLETFGIAFTTNVVRGLLEINGKVMEYSSGSTLGAFPKGGHLLVAKEMYDQKIEVADLQTPVKAESQPIGGWFQLSSTLENSKELNSGGRIIVFGDSSFVDGAGRIPNKETKTALRGF